MAISENTILSQEEFSTLLEEMVEKFKSDLIASGRTVRPLGSFRPNEYAVQ